MPTYKVTDPQSGRTVALTGDSPPTEAELEDIFSKLPAQGQGATDPSDSFMSLGKAMHDVFTHALRAASPFQPGPILDTAKEAAAPAAGGLLRQPADPSAPIGDQIARNIGAGLPVAAGTAAAAAALPVVAPAAAAAYPLLASAAATGLGAAGGDLAQQGLAKSAGGQGPDNIPDALKESGKVGLTAALTDLGVGATAKGLEMAFPHLVMAMRSFPSESIKRTIERPDEVFALAGSQKDAETAGVDALRQIQNGLKSARTQAGQAVEKELEAFKGVTGGEAVIPSDPIAEAGAQALSSRTTSDGISVLSDSEAKKVGDLVEEMTQKGPMSVDDAIKMRRRLDNLIDYKGGKVPEISSGEGQSVIMSMARELRTQIQKAAEDAGAYNLAEANANFSKVANAYDAYRPVFNTKTALGSEAVKRLEGVARMFNKGGLSQQDLTQIGQIPGLQKLQGPVDRLLDSVAARQFAMGSKGSESSLIMSAMRELLSGAPLKTAIQAGQALGSPAATGAAATAAATGASLGEQP